jgi:hypothetical protein
MGTGASLSDSTMRTKLKVARCVALIRGALLLTRNGCAAPTSRRGREAARRDRPRPDCRRLHAAPDPQRRRPHPRRKPCRRFRPIAGAGVARCGHAKRKEGSPVDQRASSTMNVPSGVGTSAASFARRCLARGFPLLRNGAKADIPSALQNRINGSKLKGPSNYQGTS